jgi:hypothetical protein
VNFVSYLSEILFFFNEFYIKQSGRNVCTAWQLTSDVRFTKKKTPMYHTKISWSFLTSPKDMFSYINNLSVYVMLHYTNSLTINFKVTGNVTFVSYLSEISFFFNEFYIKQSGRNVCAAWQFTSDVRFTKNTEQTFSMFTFCIYFYISCYWWLEKIDFVVTRLRKGCTNSFLLVPWKETFFYGRA